MSGRPRLRKANLEGLPPRVIIEAKLLLREISSPLFWIGSASSGLAGFGLEMKPANFHAHALPPRAAGGRVGQPPVQVKSADHADVVC